MSFQRPTVSVTGAGGFIGSWLVKLLLQKGYFVHGTVRDPDDPKNDHLKKLEGAEERLRLFKANLIDYQGFRIALNGCQGVFHTASPVTDDPEKMIEPAIKGTENVISAAVDAGVKRLVFTSSIGTVYMDPNRDADNVVDESCWSNLEYCKSTNNWYCYAKTVAEKVAWEMAAEREIELIVVNPVLVIGPFLQPSMNASTGHILKYLNGAVKTYANAVQAYVHVGDVAEAHVLVFESATAYGRYICAESMLHRGELVDLLRFLFPSYPIPSVCKDDVNPRVKPYKLSTKKIQDMGLKFTPMKETLCQTVKCLQDNGFLTD